MKKYNDNNETQSSLVQIEEEVLAGADISKVYTIRMNEDLIQKNHLSLINSQTFQSRLNEKSTYQFLQNGLDSQQYIKESIKKNKQMKNVSRHQQVKLIMNEMNNSVEKKQKVEVGKAYKYSQKAIVMQRSKNQSLDDFRIKQNISQQKLKVNSENMNSHSTFDTRMKNQVLSSRNKDLSNEKFQQPNQIQADSFINENSQSNQDYYNSIKQNSNERSLSRSSYKFQINIENQIKNLRPSKLSKILINQNNQIKLSHFSKRENYQLINSSKKIKNLNENLNKDANFLISQEIDLKNDYQENKTKEFRSFHQNNYADFDQNQKQISSLMPSFETTNSIQEFSQSQNINQSVLNSNRTNFFLPKIDRSAQININQITGNIATQHAVRGQSHYDSNNMSDIIELKARNSKFQRYESQKVFGEDFHQSGLVFLNKQHSVYNPGPLVASTINSQRKNFRNPFQKKQSTFGQRISKKLYLKEFEADFQGKDSPSPTKYYPNKTFFLQQKFKDKTMPKEIRECPIVQKHQLKITNVSPDTYQDLNKLSGFREQKNNSQFYGSRAARIVDVRLYAQQNHKIIKNGIY